MKLISIEENVYRIHDHMYRELEACDELPEYGESTYLYDNPREKAINAILAKIEKMYEPMMVLEERYNYG